MWVTSRVAFAKEDLHLVQLIMNVFFELFALGLVFGDVLLELIVSILETELTMTTLSLRASALVRFSGGGEVFGLCFGLVGAVECDVDFETSGKGILLSGPD